MQDLKQDVLENLKTKGYHDYQLKELNPIIQATIDATRQALSINPVVGASAEQVAVDCTHCGRKYSDAMCKLHPAKCLKC